MAKFAIVATIKTVPGTRDECLTVLKAPRFRWPPEQIAGTRDNPSLSQGSTLSRKATSLAVTRFTANMLRM
jgi:hypothetical protein